MREIPGRVKDTAVDVASGWIREQLGFAKDLLKRGSCCSLSVLGTDTELAAALMHFLRTKTELRNCQHLQSWRNISGEYGPDNDETPGQPAYVPANGRHGFTFNGRRFAIEIQPGDHEPVTITLWGNGRNSGSLRELLDESLRCYRFDHGAELFIRTTRDGYWGNPRFHQGRGLDSVILPGNTARELAEDMRYFFAARDKYRRTCVPWHRGYLFHGPPGTGKSSLVLALATECEVPIWSMQLSMLDDAMLDGLLTNNNVKGIVLLEDIDAAFTSEGVRKSLKSRGDVTLSGLLNTIDGALTPDGVAFVMTTNRVGDLDPALIRPGRIDRSVEFGPLDCEGAMTFFLRFYPGREDFAVEFAKVACGVVPAKAQEWLMSAVDPEEVLRLAKLA